MNETERIKIVRFLDDVVMSKAVKEVIREAFLKARTEKDVHYLAAKSLSVEFLEDAWRELQKFKNDDKKEEKVSKQVGL